MKHLKKEFHMKYINQMNQETDKWNSKIKGKWLRNKWEKFRDTKKCPKFITNIHKDIRKVLYPTILTNVNWKIMTSAKSVSETDQYSTLMRLVF